VKKLRTLIEGPELDESRTAVEPDLQRWDEAFRWSAYQIAVAPRVGTTPFLSPDHRILRIPISIMAELWVFFRIEPDDDYCTLLWVERWQHNNPALRL
jgi:hypothetical protein